MVRPSDERMRSLISLKAFGLSEIDAVRYYTAMHMADRGLISAPNVAVGAPFNIGGMINTNLPMTAPAESQPHNIYSKPLPDAAPINDKEARLWEGVNK